MVAYSHSAGWHGTVDGLDEVYLRTVATSELEKAKTDYYNR
jgi:hypothetical protein